MPEGLQEARLKEYTATLTSQVAPPRGTICARTHIVIGWLGK